MKFKPGDVVIGQFKLGWDNADDLEDDRELYTAAGESLIVVSDVIVTKPYSAGPVHEIEVIDVRGRRLARLASNHMHKDWFKKV